ncbi:MAG: hypothetical protein ACD_79C00467G0001 [uncultured bacterium]|nr:MAG: hypothetical protein ACD_79C00467G0001 [uncultured bacterium]
MSLPASINLPASISKVVGSAKYISGKTNAFNSSYLVVSSGVNESRLLKRVINSSSASTNTSHFLFSFNKPFSAPKSSLNKSKSVYSLPATFAL